MGPVSVCASPEAVLFTPCRGLRRARPLLRSGGPQRRRRGRGLAGRGRPAHLHRRGRPRPTAPHQGVRPQRRLLPPLHAHRTRTAATSSARSARWTPGRARASSGLLPDAGPGPDAAGQPALFSTRRPSSQESGDELALIPDGASPSSNIHAGTLEPRVARRFEFQENATITTLGRPHPPDGDSIGPDGNAYVAFQRQDDVQQIADVDGAVADRADRHSDHPSPRRALQVSDQTRRSGSPRPVPRRGDRHPQRRLAERGDAGRRRPST